MSVHPCVCVCARVCVFECICVCVCMCKCAWGMLSLFADLVNSFHNAFFALVYIALGWLSSFETKKHKSLNFDTSPIPGGGRGEFRRQIKRKESQ